MNNKVSVVIPVYKCSLSIVELTERLKAVLSGITNNYEIIYVNDASPENDWDIIKKLASKEKRIKGINFSRNFGQHYAITAGLSHSKGEWMVVMDGDLQDVPEEIPVLYKKAQEGFEIVCAQRIIRKDKFLRRLTSKLFYQIFSYLTDTHQDERISNFGIYHREIIDAVLSMKDQNRYFPTMVQWVGFRKTNIEVQHHERLLGKSSYSYKSLLFLAFNNIISFSDKPLKLTIKLGFIISLSSFLVGIFYLIKYLKGYIIVLGFASLIISVWFIGGLIIAILGLTGIYLGRIFEQVKDRPKFLISEKVNYDS